MGWLSLATALVSLLVKLYEQAFSDSAQLNRLRLKLADLKARQQIEAERLKSRYAEIDRQPDTSGQTLVDNVNISAKKLREP